MCNQNFERGIYGIQWRTKELLLESTWYRGGVGIGCDHNDNDNYSNGY